MAETVEFVVNGSPVVLSRSAVLAAMRDVDPEPIRSHSVAVGGVRYPVKQVFAEATGLDRLDFTSSIARRQLGRLDFDLKRS